MLQQVQLPPALRCGTDARRFLPAAKEIEETEEATLKLKNEAKVVKCMAHLSNRRLKCFGAQDEMSLRWEEEAKPILPRVAI